MNRDALISAFLERNGYAKAHAEPLAQDASFRRYLRLSRGPRQAVLMDAPPPENIRPFIRTAAHLAHLGTSVPEIFAADEAEGLLLEEDLGDDLLSVFIDQAPPTSLSREAGEGWGGGATHPLTPLFDAAVDTLVAIQRVTPPPDLPQWDAHSMARHAPYPPCCDWWWPAMFGTEPPVAARHHFAIALATTLAPVAAGPRCFVHRDFFAGNLIWLPNRSGHPPDRHPRLPGRRASVIPPTTSSPCCRTIAATSPPTSPSAPSPATSLRAPSWTPTPSARLRRMRSAAASAHRLPMGAPRASRRSPWLPAHGPRTWRLLNTPCGSPPPRRSPPPWTVGSHRTALQPTGSRGVTARPRTAMLLAAGLGTRMRPLTDHTAKPLLPLGGRPLIDHALDRLVEAAVQTVVVNAYWHADRIAAHLRARTTHPPRTILEREAAPLDTGGGAQPPSTCSVPTPSTSSTATPTG